MYPIEYTIISNRDDAKDVVDYVLSCHVMYVDLEFDKNILTTVTVLPVYNKPDELYNPKTVHIFKYDHLHTDHSINAILTSSVTKLMLYDPSHTNIPSISSIRYIDVSIDTKHLSHVQKILLMMLINTVL